MAEQSKSKIMNPTEKVKELIEKFYNNMPLCADRTSRRMFAKQCAIICVDEVIKALDEVSIGESGRVFINYGQSEQRRIKEDILKQ